MMNVPLAKRILPEGFDDLKLNPRQLKFVAAYCTNGFDSTLAAQASGYITHEKESKTSWALKTLKHPAVLEAIKRFISMAIGPYKERLEYQVLDVYYRRAVYDIATFYDDTGSLIPLSEIPPAWRICIDGTEKRYFGKDGNRVQLSYKLADRDTALQTLYRFAVRFNGEEDPGEGILPGEARDRLKKVFAGVMGAPDNKARLTLSATLSQTVEVKKPGRPKKIAPEA